MSYKDLIMENAYCKNEVFYYVVSNTFPAGIYLFKANIGNIRTGCDICSKLTARTLEWPTWYCSGVFSVNFEHILHIGWLCKCWKD